MAGAFQNQFRQMCRHTNVMASEHARVCLTLPVQVTAGVRR